MSIGTITKDETIRLQAAEIEHMSERHAAEIERLREENGTFSDSLAAKADRIDRLGETVAQQVVEIERLRDARNELVVAIHSLASHFENALYAFRDDDEARKKAEGDIAWAMEIAGRHNHNGDGVPT